MSQRHGKVWLSWEDHRRSKELARSFNAELVTFTSESPRWRRYPSLSLKTTLFLLKDRPALVFCQNPSIVLTALVLVIRSILKYKVVVDRHSNFKFEYQNSRSLKWKVFHWVSQQTLRKANLTIVTNSAIKEFCEEIGSNTVILPDKLPVFDLTMEDSVYRASEKHQKKIIMVITMFDADEPIPEVIEAGRKLGDDCLMYMTGNFKKMYSDSDKEVLLSEGVVFTGFIPESDYLRLMHSADVVVVLTKKDLILNCGAYEGLAMGKPLVLSSTKTIKDYFCFGSVYVEPTSEDIFRGILFAIENNKIMRQEIIDNLPDFRANWIKSFKKIEALVNSL